MLSEGAVESSKYYIFARLSLKLTCIYSRSFDLMFWCLWKPVGRALLVGCNGSMFTQCKWNKTGEFPEFK